VFVKISEQRQATVLQRRATVFVLAMESRDVVVDELRGRGVVANNYEARKPRRTEKQPDCGFRD